MKSISFIIIAVGIIIIIFSFLLRVNSIDYNTQLDNREEITNDDKDLKMLLENTKFFIRIIGIIITLLGIIMYLL